MPEWPLHGSSAARSQRRSGSRRAARRHAGDGAWRAPARSARWWKAPGWKPLFRERGKVSVAAWTPRGTHPREVAGRRRRVSERGRTGRTRAPARVRHGTLAPPTSDVARGQSVTRASRDFSSVSAALGSPELVAWVGTEAPRRRRNDAGTEARWIVPRGSVDTAALSHLPQRWLAITRGARDETFVAGWTRGEGKGALGLHEAASFTRRGGGGLGRTGLDPRSPRVTQRADTDRHRVLSGARAPSTSAHRAGGEGVGDEASEVRRWIPAETKRSGKDCRPAEASSRRETESSRVAWDATRSEPRRRGTRLWKRNRG